MKASNPSKSGNRKYKCFCDDEDLFPKDMSRCSSIIDPRINRNAFDFDLILSRIEEAIIHGVNKARPACQADADHCISITKVSLHIRISKNNSPIEDLCKYAYLAALRNTIMYKSNYKQIIALNTVKITPVLTDKEKIPSRVRKGKNTFIIADVNGDIHVRCFNRYGEQYANITEKESLSGRNAAVLGSLFRELRKLGERLRPPHKIKPREKFKIIMLFKNGGAEIPIRVISEFIGRPEFHEPADSSPVQTQLDQVIANEENSSSTKKMENLRRIGEEVGQGLRDSERRTLTTLYRLSTGAENRKLPSCAAVARAIREESGQKITDQTVSNHIEKFTKRCQDHRDWPEDWKDLPLEKFWFLNLEILFSDGG